MRCNKLVKTLRIGRQTGLQFVWPPGPDPAICRLLAGRVQWRNVLYSRSLVLALSVAVLAGCALEKRLLYQPIRRGEMPLTGAPSPVEDVGLRAAAGTQI